MCRHAHSLLIKYSVTGNILSECLRILSDCSQLSKTCKRVVRLFRPRKSLVKPVTTRNKNSCSAVCDDVTYRLSDRRCTSHVLLLTEPVDSDLKLLLRLAAVQLVIGRDWKVYVCTPPHCASPSPAAIHRQNKGRAP